MKKIINLTKNPRAVIEKIFAVYNENRGIPFFQLQRGEEQYTIKYTFKDGLTAVIDVTVAPDCYRFHVEQQGSALMMTKPEFPPFDVGLSYSHSRNGIKYHSTPHQKDARIWLQKRDSETSTTCRADALVMLATTCEIIWSYMLPCMKMREYENTIEYAPRDDFMTFVDTWVNVMRRKWKEEHLLDGWDTISLTEKQFEKIKQIIAPNGFDTDLTHTSLNRFCLNVYRNGEHELYFFERMLDGMHITLDTLEGDTRHDFAVTLANEPGGDIKMSLCMPIEEPFLAWLHERTADADGNESDTETWEWIVYTYFGINTFLLYYGDISMDVEEKIATAQSEPSERKSKKQQRNTTRLFKCYTLKKNWASRVARKKAEITCPAWGVRGHFRHYRNGKVVFIESYVKGKEKDKYRGKEYALVPYKDA